MESLTSSKIARLLTDAYPGLTAQQWEQRLVEAVGLDHITGLPTRAAFEAKAAEMLELARRTGSKLYISMIDADGLKAANDAFGHQAGDRLLADLGAEIVSKVRKSDYVARIGGDEFAVLSIAAEEPRKPELSNGSYGCAKVSTTIAQALDSADREMYTDKIARKAQRK